MTVKITPRAIFVEGTAKYPPKLDRPHLFDEKLNRSRPANNGEEGDARYELVLNITEDDAKAIEAECVKIFQGKYGPKKSPNNLPTHYDLDDKQWHIKSTIRGAFGDEKVGPIPAIDSKKNPIEEVGMIGTGSKMVLKCGLIAYNTGTVNGVTARLRVVQVLELAEAKADLDGFDEADGYVADAPSNVSGDEGFKEDDIPF